MITSRRASLIVCCLLASGLAEVSGKVAPSPDHTRIVGGYVTSQGQFPSMVALYHHSLFGKSFICGGTLLNADHVLTAAQCIKDYSASSIEAVVGEQNLNEDSGLEQSQRASLKVMHDFTTTTGANDIGILRMSSPFTLEAGIVEAVQLPSDYQTPSSNCTAVGWGYAEYGGYISAELRAVDLPYLTDQECIEIYGEDEILMDMMCAGVFGGAGMCTGDAGGPLFCDGVQMGIISRGLHCDENPGICTEVSHYLDWIEINSNA